MKTKLLKKINRAIRLLQSIEGEVEIAYSGGKDSDVILQLAKESGISFRAVYKNTTIDPPGTIKHVREVGAEILQPKKNFGQLIEDKGLPNRFRRFCCAELKEYKVGNKVVIGIRKAESRKRSERYKEPTECRYYGKKTEANHVVQYYPILDWTDEDIRDFVLDRGIKLHPLYYTEGRDIDVTRRLGCMCCPLASQKKRIAEFKKYPLMLRYYARHANIFYKKKKLDYDNVFEWLVRDIFYSRQSEFNKNKEKNLFDDKIDYKSFLENYFKIKL